RLWLGAAGLAVLGGGNFHAHYYVQLGGPPGMLRGVAPGRGVDGRCAVVGRVGAGMLRERRSGVMAGICAGLAVWSRAAVVPLWFDSPAAQARGAFPNDPHLQHDAEVIDYVRQHTRPGRPFFVMGAGATVYSGAAGPPPVPYMWFRNIQ